DRETRMALAAKSTLTDPGVLVRRLIVGTALLLKATRPRQWLKNLFVLAPVLFAGKIGDFSLLLRALAAVACFCGLSGAIYLINDLCDRHRDALHPLKRFRPLA